MNGNDEKIHTKEELKWAFYLNSHVKINIDEGKIDDSEFNNWYKKTFEKPEPIPFNLELYESGSYECVTRDNRNARLLGAIKNDELPLVFAHTVDKQKENYSSFSLSGTYYYGLKESPNDIFLIPKS